MSRLLIHFTAQDLARTRVAANPDTLWELVLSLHWLQRQRPSGGLGAPAPAEVNQWRTNARTSLSGQALGHQVRSHLFPLAPVSSYFPDFLTPYEGLCGLDQGLDTVLSTSRRQIGRELEKLTTRSGTPSWGAELADGALRALHSLNSAMRGYFTTALAPAWSVIRARVAVEHTRLAGILATRDMDAMLACLRPTAIWHRNDRILEAAYPTPLTIHLAGRGLTLIPSWFCSGAPVALADPALPPVLVYPLTHDPVAKTDPDALAKLIGPTRAKILAAITTGTPTRLIQRQTGISTSQISRHTAVLRDNNLIAEARHGGQVFYTRTSLGQALATSP